MNNKYFLSLIISWYFLLFPITVNGMTADDIARTHGTPTFEEWLEQKKEEESVMDQFSCNNLDSMSFDDFEKMRSLHINKEALVDRCNRKNALLKEISCQKFLSEESLSYDKWRELENVGIDKNYLIKLCKENTNNLKDEKKKYETDQFSFELSNDWSEFTQEMSQNVVSKIGKNIAAVDQAYVTAFMPISAESEYPYVILSKGGSVVSLDQLNQERKMLEGGLDEKNKNKIEDRITQLENELGSDIFGNMMVDDVIFDENRKLEILKSTSEYPDVGKVYIISLIFLGQKENVYINFYSLQQDFGDIENVFLSIKNSFEWKEGYGYIMEQDVIAPSIFDDVLNIGVTGIIKGVFLSIGIFVFIALRYLIIKISKKRENK